MSHEHMLNPNQFGYDGASHPTLESQVILGKIPKQKYGERDRFTPPSTPPVRTRYLIPVDKTAEKDKGLLSDHYETDEQPNRPHSKMQRWVSPN